jgi:hypothetical protein
MCINENIYIKSEGMDEKGKYTIKIPYKNLENFNVVENAKVSVKASLKYFDNIVKLSNVFKSFDFNIEKNSPICISVDEEHIKFKYFISLKIDEQDNENEDDELNNLEETNEVIET